MNTMDPEALYFIPLGGCGEIGMNLNVYAWKGALMVVDCGVSFDRAPGGQTVVMMPDATWLMRRRASIAGLVLTHIHEDHIGAVAALWPWLRCPIIATPFTATVLRGKLAQAGLGGVVPVREVEPNGRTDVGPFPIRFIGITHSTAESQCVVIHTDYGRILHTGDWKFDPSPLVGPRTNTTALAALGKQGIFAAISDSTNATRPGRSGSEKRVRDYLQQRLAGLSGRIVSACFASNIARLRTLLEVAQAQQRHPILLGTSLHRMYTAARAHGYLQEDYGLVPAEHAGYLPRERVMLICTGTQGEPEAAMARLAQDRHRNILLDAGDTAVFSSKIIPGNELPIAWLHGRLGEMGLQVISEREEPDVHVSGHPCQDELAQMYGWVRPQLVIPVHGTARHIAAHAALARSMDIDTIEMRNGAVLRLAPGPAQLIDQVRAGRVPRPDVERGEHLPPPDQQALNGRM